jgi:3-oxoacyl-[acyl-carrier-protein] synthase III
MQKVLVKILGTGVFLPSLEVSSEKLEKQLGYPSGTFDKASGVKRRYHATDENASDLGAAAVKKALEV